MERKLNLNYLRKKAISRGIALSQLTVVFTLLEAHFRKEIDIQQLPEATRLRCCQILELVDKDTPLLRLFTQDLIQN